MSPRAAAEFSKQWPALQRRLRAFLRNKGVTSSEIEDLTQEVATRLLSFWHKVDRSKPVWPLVATIALNLLRDRGRRHDVEVLGELPDIPGSPDAADAGIARMELAAVLRAMEDLTPSQRAALLQVVDPAVGDARSTSAQKMLRMRARRRLANVVGRACAGFTIRFRRTADAVGAFFTKADGVAQALACATCLFVASAGSAVLLPSFDGSLGTATAAPAATDHVVTNSQQRRSTVASGVVPRAEQLRPARTSTGAEKTRSGASSKKVKTASDDGATTGAVTAPAPTTGLPLPGQAPVPGNPPVPAGPPATPDTPNEPPPVSVDTNDGPEESPVQVPVEAPLPSVGDVTRTVRGAGG